MNNKELSDSYKRIFLIVQNIINSVDPESLDPGLPDGAPVDEYEMEVAPITSFLVKNLKQNSLDKHFLSEEINRVWMQFFEKQCADSEKIAEEIIKKISV